jgi:transcription termination factor Rho
MATKKSTGSKEPKPKAPKAAPAKVPAASRQAAKGTGSAPPAKRAGARSASVKASTKATSTTKAAVGAAKAAKAPRSKASTRTTDSKPTAGSKRPAKPSKAPTTRKRAGTGAPAASTPLRTDACIDLAPTLAPDAGALTASTSVGTLDEAVPTDPTLTEAPAPVDGGPGDPPAPTVRPVFRRVGSAWLKFDPSDLDGIAKAEAEAAAIAANPELAPPPPPAPPRQQHRQDHPSRREQRVPAAAAVLDGASTDREDANDPTDDDADDGDGPHWEGGDAHQAPEPPAPIEQLAGILDISGNEARLRQFGSNGWVHSHDEPQIPMDLVQRFNLRNGNQVSVQVQMVRARRRRGPKKLRRTVVGIESVEGLDPSAWAARPPYGELTSIDPQPRMHLEYRGCPPSCRLIDLFCPIGFGTRGLIVAPPKAGKTILLQQIAHGIKHNHPQVELIALLIDERPEEVTDFKRNVPALVLASSNDQDLEKHTQMGIMAIERARRLFEAGKDVVVLLDSLTRLGRAFNNNRRYSTGGRTMSGGLDSRALEVPKQLFGAARKAEEGGSLTIIATCLVDTGSRADQVIFEEFKGTGNMELILDRSIAERRVYPAINLAASGTRKEHLLMGERELKTMTALRRRLMTMPPFVQVEQLVAAVNRSPDNETLVRGSGG